MTPYEYNAIGIENESMPWFEVPSGRLFMADPIYLLNKDLAVVIAPIKPGRWRASVLHESPHRRYVSSVTIFHESELERDGTFDREVIHKVPVDTGRVCFIDSWWLGGHENADLLRGLRIDRFRFIVPSGFGDWIYEACVREFMRQAVSVRIVFIGTEGTK